MSSCLNVHYRCWFKVSLVALKHMCERTLACRVCAAAAEKCLWIKLLFPDARCRRRSRPGHKPDDRRSSLPDSSAPFRATRLFEAGACSRLQRFLNNRATCQTANAVTVIQTHRHTHCQAEREETLTHCFCGPFSICSSFHGFTMKQ